MGTPRAFDDYPPVMNTAQVAEMLSLPSIKTVQVLVRKGRVSPPIGSQVPAGTGSCGTRSSNGWSRMQRG